MDSEKNKRLYAKIVARAWTDDAFKQELLNDPGKTVRDAGMVLPPDAVVSIVETGNGFVASTTGQHPTLELTLPPRPANLTDEAILSYTGDEFIASLGVSSSSDYS
jgi:hypothetical protein